MILLFIIEIETEIIVEDIRTNDAQSCGTSILQILDSLLINIPSFKSMMM
jgi:hypothetical protein